MLNQGSGGNWHRNRTMGSRASVSAAPLAVDLLVVGGGIQGVGVARDAAGRGLTVCVIDQADLAAHTSSASTKLIHGGLRYLEYGEFRLVRESLAERERLMSIAPHLTRALRFVLPHVETLRPRWQLGLGLLLYDFLSRREHLPGSRALRFDREPMYGELNASLIHGFAYSDCAVDDARLVVANALDAAERGATILTRTSLVDARVQRGQWLVRCQSERLGEIMIGARALVNASGPWVNQVLTRCGVRQREDLRLVKGSHIVVPRIHQSDHAYALQNIDRRLIFAIPFERDWTLIGTTDVPFSGDASSVQISHDERAYLCESVNRYFHHPVDPDSIAWSFAGVRALSAPIPGNPSAASRDYEIDLVVVAECAPIVSILGGKLTTYRRLAEEVLARLHPRLGGNDRSWTATAVLPGGDLGGMTLEDFVVDVARRWPFLDSSLSRRLACAYGSRVELILGNSRSLEALGDQFGAGLTEAEVEYLRREEWAESSTDVLWRRSKLGLRIAPADQERLAQCFAKTKPGGALCRVM